MITEIFLNVLHKCCKMFLSEHLVLDLELKKKYNMNSIKQTVCYWRQNFDVLSLFLGVVMDRRQEKTKKEIFKAFTNLLLNESYSRITVSDVIGEADVGRTTFYSHYSTKDELLEDYCLCLFEDVKEKAKKAVISEDNLKNKTCAFTDSLNSSRYKVIELMTSQNRELIIKYFKDYLKEPVAQQLNSNTFGVIGGIEDEFLINYISSTFFETMLWWISRGRKESTGEITTRFLSIIEPVLRNKLHAGKRSAPVVDVDNNYRMKRNGTTQKDIRVINYLNALEILSQSTDDFLFLLDISSDTNWFFGPVDNDFTVRKAGESINSTNEILSIVHPADRKSVKTELSEIAQGVKDVLNMNCRWINRNGEVVWVNCRGKVIEDEKGKPFVMIGRVSREALNHLYNPLTGLFNKVKMREDLKEEFHNLTKGHLMLIDVDDLSAINLSHGRNYGDMLLTELAALIESNPYVDRVYHTELSFFAAWLNTTCEQTARSVFYFIQEGLSQKCTVSAGVVPLDSSLFIDHTNLYDSAKITLRNAKDKGKGNIEFFTPEDIKRSIYSVEMIEEFHESVNNNFEGFMVNYQPQVKAGNYNIFSVEALMRYHSPTRGPVYPDEFIPLLEKTGLINPVGMWILEEALNQCKTWRKKIPELRVSVNFSTVQFRAKDIVAKILSVLNKTGMPGDALTIEITESIPLHEIDHFSGIISRLKSEGIQIAIDDFGTGYSNIGYLKKLDVDEIKIDRMFVSGIEENTYNYKLISNTMEFAKMNSIRVCCEGVENSRELAVLEVLSPDVLQGYLFDKPCEVKEFEESYIDKKNEKYKTRIKFIKQLYEYKEQMGVIHFDPIDILRETDVGLWIIRINEAQNYRELYIDETMERILGIDKKYTPRETYDFWFNKINEDYVKYVSDNLKIMTERNGVVQLQYKWMHPTLGRVEVRSNGRRTKGVDGMIVLEGYHRIFSNIEEL